MADDMPQAKRRYPTETAEIVDRVRRIETRLTKFMEAQGFDTQVARALWVPDPGYVLVPSPAVAIRDVISAIPADYAGLMVGVKVGSELLFTVHVPVTRM